MSKNKFTVKFSVSKSIANPISIESRRFYTNVMRIWFLLNNLKKNRKIQYTPQILRILLNLYNSNRNLIHLGLLFGIKDIQSLGNKIKSSKRINPNTFNQILGYLLSKKLIKNEINQKGNLIFQTTEKLSNLLGIFDQKEIEPNLFLKLKIINSILSNWDTDNFLNFMKKEMRDLI